MLCDRAARVVACASITLCEACQRNTLEHFGGRKAVVGGSGPNEEGNLVVLQVPR